MSDHEISDEAIEAAWTQWWYEAWPHGTEPKAEKAFKAGAKWAAALPHMSDGKGEALSEELTRTLAVVDEQKATIDRLTAERDDWRKSAEWVGDQLSAMTKADIERNIAGLRALLRLSPTGDDSE